MTQPISFSRRDFSPRARRSPPPAWRPFRARPGRAALPPGRPELHHGRGRSLRTGHAGSHQDRRRRGQRGGGAAGRQFQLYAEDDQTKPDAAVLAVKKLIEINKVEAVIGIWPSSVGLAAMPITNAAGLITMNTCGAPEMLTENKRGLAWMFQASNAVFGRAFAEVAPARLQAAGGDGVQQPTFVGRPITSGTPGSRAAATSAPSSSTSPTRPPIAPS